MIVTISVFNCIITRVVIFRRHHYSLHEPGPELVGQRAPPRVERVLERVPCHVGQVGGVDVGEAEQAPREEARVSDM